MKGVDDGGCRRHHQLLALVVTLMVFCAVLYQQSRLLKQFGNDVNGDVPSKDQQQQQQQQPCAVNMERSNRPHAQLLPPIHVNSSWIGNQWIPGPGYKLYSGGEIQNLLSNYSILFMGDSTARRTYATLYGILNTTFDPSNIQVKSINDPSVIDVNKQIKTERCRRKKNRGFWLCRTNPQDPTKSFDLMGWSCLQELAQQSHNKSSFFWNEVSNYNLVIFTAGPWELMVRCPGGDKWKSYMDTFLDALFRLENLHPNVTFVWRTWGYQNVANPDRVPNLLKRTSRYNDYIMERLDKHTRKCW